MPNNTLEKWEEKTVKDVTEICLGLTHTPKYVDEGVPFLSVKDISSGYIDFSNTKFITREEFESLPNGAKPKKGDVLFARVGTLGCPSIVDTDTEFGTFVSLGYFRPDNKLVLNTYLRYWMFSPLFWKQVEQNVQGSTLKNLNTGWLKDFKIPIPSIDEQQRIVGILDEAFENIEKAKQNALQNLNNAKELFESTLKNNCYNSNNDWKTNRADSFFILQRGYDLPVQERKKGKYPLISSNGVSDYINQYKIKAPAVVTGRSGTIGKVHYVNEDFWPLNTSLYIKDFKGNLPKFIYYFLQAMDLQKFSSGTGVPTLNRNYVHEVKISFPTLEEQQKIVQQLDELQEQTKKLEQIYEQKNKDLDELKQSILQKAFNGEL